MKDSGTIVVIDLTSRQIVQTVDVSTILGKSAVGAIFERAPGQLIVGAYQVDPSVEGPTYLAAVNLSDPGSAHRVGRAQGYFDPAFVASPDAHYLYIRGIYVSSTDAWHFEKRDLTTPDLTLVATETNPIDDISFSHVAFSPDGTLMYGNGIHANIQVIDTTTLRTVAEWDTGVVPFISADGGQLLAVGWADMETWSLTSFQPLTIASGNCQSLDLDYGVAAYAVWPDGSRFVNLSVGNVDVPGSVCVMNSTP
jgi:hypothetical protein